ncbi:MULTISPECIES: hypothetical protein [Brachybacterium]|uniref:Siderophore-interacting protein C-terminal domain-containing protein n=1 Tax=Brachybacterium alimentarium TaxID=47845 RepID=A0A2A3YJH8_9MICO|nr:MULTISPECIES: hypothetical protein [Brachybacterium]PCC33608.1 hypothetical protein CIK71_07885 [Brachybacterium alimentarium]PCC39389.1 hypothetical protein CIK66_08995 [Brachybacterium alimentarium]RCS66344.1 hypothetical protein CIK81_03880 [Brachybacterium sp. JB7]RCS74556.1 hypothetical protein CIK73_00080 [Brachybacterium alimentarium]RCS75296.1 hypothetical protein CIK68_04175 [Brachybacterium alimentarium]
MPARPDRHLLIGDEQDLPLLRALLPSFPQDASGELVLELPAEHGPLPSTPPGISTRILPCEPGTPGGLRACAALDAWAGEWLHGDHARPEAHSIFVGLTGNLLVTRLCEALATRHRGLHMHRPSHAGSPL